MERHFVLDRGCSLDQWPGASNWAPVSKHSLRFLKCMDVMSYTCIRGGHVSLLTALLMISRTFKGCNNVNQWDMGFFLGFRHRMLMFFFDGLRSFTAEMKSIFEEVSFFVFDFGRFLPCTKTVGFSRCIMIWWLWRWSFYVSFNEGPGRCGRLKWCYIPTIMEYK